MSSKLHLLLKDPESGDTFRPFAAFGALSTEAPDPSVQGDRKKPDTLAHSGSLNDIDQGWGVLYPGGPLGMRLLDAVSALREWREKQVKERDCLLGVSEWAIVSGYSARRFVSEIYNKLPRVQRPLYVLILGDYDKIPDDYEHVLGEHAIVGRLCLQNESAYEAYAKKVVDSESLVRGSGTRETPRVVLYSPSGTRRRDRAIEFGQRLMITPLVEHLGSHSVEQWGLDAGSVFQCGPRRDEGMRTWEDTARLASVREPTVMVSLSHGAGRSSWGADEQREFQGRMMVDGKPIELDILAQKPFLPHGAWFYYACFGACTPATSRFAPWLRRLHGSGVYSRVPDVLATQARGGSFAALQPQLALANPQGPLAVFAHSDIAFTYAFAELPGQRETRQREPHPVPQAISALVDELIQGSRVGVALKMLADPIHLAAHEIRRAYQRLAARSDEVARRFVDGQFGRLPSAAVRDRVDKATKDALLLRGIESITLDEIARRAGLHPLVLLAAHESEETRAQLSIRHHNWMAYHDLKSWRLLGDPAARLPVAKNCQPAKISREEYFRYVDLATEAPVAEEVERQEADAAEEPQDAAPEPGAELVASLEKDDLVAAIRGFMVARSTQRSGKAVAEDFGIEYEALKRWEEYVSSLMSWAIERVRSRGNGDS